MGNNAAFASFEYFVMVMEEIGSLTPENLIARAKLHAGSDIDSGGSRDLKDSQDRDIFHLVVETISPDFSSDNEDDFWNEWERIRREIFQWH